MASLGLSTTIIIALVCGLVGVLSALYIMNKYKDQIKEMKDREKSEELNKKDKNKL